MLLFFLKPNLTSSFRFFIYLVLIVIGINKYLPTKKFKIFFVCSTLFKTSDTNCVFFPLCVISQAGQKWTTVANQTKV